MLKQKNGKVVEGSKTPDWNMLTDEEIDQQVIILCLSVKDVSLGSVLQRLDESSKHSAIKDITTWKQFGKPLSVNMSSLHLQMEPVMLTVVYLLWNNIFCHDDNIFLRDVAPFSSSKIPSFILKA